MARKLLNNYGYDLGLGMLAAFYAFTVPYTKVEESFNAQAMHDILYHRHHLDQYDHLEFPGVVPRTFIGAWIVSTLASPIVTIISNLYIDKIYSLLAARSVLGIIILSSLRFFRSQIQKRFGYLVEGFFVILTAIQFHLLFYSTRPLPNIFALGLVNMSYGYWLKGSCYRALQFLIVSAVAFRCDMVLLLGPIGLELLLTRSISVMKAFKICSITALTAIGLSVLIDSVMWQRKLWPEFQVFWFNSVLNRSSEWGVQPFHWYFTSALPRSLVVAYPLSMFEKFNTMVYALSTFCSIMFSYILPYNAAQNSVMSLPVGPIYDRRILPYFLPVLSFVILYSKLPHKELRFIISSAPMFNLSAAIAASRIKKGLWRFLYLALVGLLLISVGCTLVLFMASYQNYPSGYALDKLHHLGHVSNSSGEIKVHIDTFSAINGITRFCEKDFPWRYSKEEGLAVHELRHKNFTYLLNEHSRIDGFQCLFSVEGFSGLRLRKGVPPLQLINEPKVYVHGSMSSKEVMKRQWPGCPWWA